MHFKNWLTIGLVLTFGSYSIAQNSGELFSKVMETPNLIALWDFKEPQGAHRKSSGPHEFSLIEKGGHTPRENEGPLSGYSARFDGNNYLSMPNSSTGDLNIHGDNKEVTVLAWIKWDGDQIGFVGGMWNEHEGGGQRQYGLFVSLPYYNGKDQVCGHISQTGKPTPPFPYSIDYSASKQRVKFKKWQFIVFTYDGRFIKSYVNGKFKNRKSELIDHTLGFPGYPEGLEKSKNPYYFPHGMGNNGSDFTIGAVLLGSGMGNFYKGLMGGLAVFDRALTDKEIRELGKSSQFMIQE